MLGDNHFVKFLAVGAVLLAGISAVGQERVSGYVFNIDNGKGLSSADISFEFYRLKEEYGNSNAGLCDNKHEAAPAVFHTQTSPGGAFAISNVPFGQYLLVAHLGSPSPISVCLTVISTVGMDREKCFRCNHMIVRYSEKRRFFKGDILMADPHAQWIPFGCEAIHVLDGWQALPATRVLFKYEDGRPLVGASITAYYHSMSWRRPQNRIGSVKTDAKGVADLAAIYSRMMQMNRRHWKVALDIIGLDSVDALNGNEASLRVALVRGVSSTAAQLILFKFNCGPDSSSTRWDGEVVTK